MGIIPVGLHPHVFILCLPDVNAHDQTSQAFPPQHLHTASDQRLEEVETAWEQG